MKQITTDYTERQMELLEQLCADRGVGRPEMLRRALDMLLDSRISKTPSTARALPGKCPGLGVATEEEPPPTGVSLSSSAPAKAKPTASTKKQPAGKQPSADLRSVPIPELLATQQFRAAWELRIAERLEAPAKERPTATQLVAQLRKLEKLAVQRGVSAAVSCVERAAECGYQGVVYPDDFTRPATEFPAASVAAKILADTPPPAPKKPTDKPGWEALKDLDDHMWNTARAGGFPGFVGGKDQARFDTFAFGGKAAIKTMADLEILRRAFDQAVADPSLWFSPASMRNYENPVACADGSLPNPEFGGERCPRCGKPRAPSGIDGGAWVHFPVATQKSVAAPTQGGD